MCSRGALRQEPSASATALKQTIITTIRILIHKNTHYFATFHIRPSLSSWQPLSFSVGCGPAEKGRSSTHCLCQGPLFSLARQQKRAPCGPLLCRRLNTSTHCGGGARRSQGQPRPAPSSARLEVCGATGVRSSGRQVSSLLARRTHMPVRRMMTWSTLTRRPLNRNCAPGLYRIIVVV